MGGSRALCIVGYWNFDDGTAKMRISNNVITGASIVGINCSDSVNVNINNIVENRLAAIYNNTPNEINVTYNYWGTTNENEIAAMIKNEGGGSIKFKSLSYHLRTIIPRISSINAQYASNTNVIATKLSKSLQLTGMRATKQANQ